MTHATLAPASAGLRDAMAAYEIIVGEPLIPDGKLHRCHVEGDRRGSRNGWYVWHSDGAAAGAFGCHRRYPGQTFTWRAETWREADPAERAEWTRKIAAERRRREAEEVAAAARAAQRARQEWDAAGQASNDHPYLVRKAVGAHGIRQTGASLVVPVRDTSGAIYGLQLIAPDGTKRFRSGTSKVGHYCPIGRLRAVLVLCEGYATGATIHEATGHAVAVAFDAGNLEPVAVALASKYPTTEIIVAADNDHRTPGNPGLTAARAAARAAGGRMEAPEFEAGAIGTDWNDYSSLHGLEAVSARLLDSRTDRRAA